MMNCKITPPPTPIAASEAAASSGPGAASTPRKTWPTGLSGPTVAAPRRRRARPGATARPRIVGPPADTAYRALNTRRVDSRLDEGEQPETIAATPISRPELRV